MQDNRPLQAVRHTWRELSVAVEESDGSAWIVPGFLARKLASWRVFSNILKISLPGQVIRAKTPVDIHA
jgi:hypothetical protein